MLIYLNRGITRELFYLLLKESINKNTISTISCEFVICKFLSHDYHLPLPSSTTLKANKFTVDWTHYSVFVRRIRIQNTFHMFFLATRNDNTTQLGHGQPNPHSVLRSLLTSDPLFSDQSGRKGTRCTVSTGTKKTHKQGNHIHPGKCATVKVDWAAATAGDGGGGSK